MSEIVEFLLSREFAALASLSSVLSLLLTFAVFIGVRRIRKHYVFTARIPELIDRLGNHASQISSLLDSDSIEATSMYETLAEAEVTLKSLKRKIGGSVKAEAGSLIKQISALRLSGSESGNWLPGFMSKLGSTPATNRENHIRRVYLAMYKITSECKEAYEDARWEQTP